EGSGMGADPVSQRLRPARLSVGEVGGAHDGDENLRPADLAGEPINDHRHRVAGVIDKQLVAADVSLPHRHRQPRRPTAGQLAEAGIAIPVGASVAGRIKRVTFIKTNLGTLSNNFEQRFMQLSFTASASGVRAVAPSNPFLATPGNYLVL